MTAVPAAVRTARPDVLRPVLVASILLTAAAGLLCETLNTSDLPTRAVVWGGLAFAAYALGLFFLFACRGADQRLRNWRFGSWIMLWSAVSFGVATVTWSQPQTGQAAEIAVASVLRALWLVAVGLTALAVGYAVGPGARLRASAARVVASVRGTFGSEVRTSAPWILTVVGLLASVVSALTTGRLGYIGNAAMAVSTATSYGQVLSTLSLCAPLGLAAAALRAFQEQTPGTRTTLAVLFLVEVGFGAATGAKQDFVVAVLALAIPFSATRRRLPKSTLAVLVLVFLIVVVPFTQAYRDAARGTTGSTGTLTLSEAVDTAPEVLRQTLTGYDLVSAIPVSSAYLLERVREIDSVAIIVQRTPSQIGYIPATQLAIAPLAQLVPRAIWSGKPILASGYEFAQQYFDVPSTIYTSDAITPVGDLFRHGGWIPVVFGMFLIGCGVRLLDDVLDVGSNPHATFLVLLLFQSLVFAEEDWATLLAAIPVALAVWFFAVALAFRRSGAT
jgi:hypothetical protein